MTIGPKFVKDLTQALSLRRVSEGAAMLDRAEEALAKLLPTHPHAADLLLLIAQWVDVGYRDYHLLDSLLLKFPTASRRNLRLDDYLRLRMVDGFRALSVEDVDTAIEHLDFALKAEQESPDDALVTLAHFWKGRAHRKKGEYEAALQEIARARELAQQSRENAKFTAVIQIHEAWLLFQRG
jgi:tetratricopeptide (TPR) repeat protein